MTHPEFTETRDKLAQHYPERCRQHGLCSMIGMKVTSLATSVELGEISLADAEEQAKIGAADVDKNCWYGQDMSGGDFPHPTCNYGLLCRFPDLGGGLLGS